MRDQSVYASLTEIWKRIQQLPVAVVTTFVIGVIALLTRTTHEPLLAAWRARLGVSPADVWRLRWRRLLTAPLVTDGGHIFWSGITITTIVTAHVERRWGSRRAWSLFWTSHVFTMLAEALIGTMLVSWQPARWQGFFHARDVGPSAAYFGMLGYISAHLRAPWHALVGAASVSILTAVFWRPYRGLTDRDLRWLADVAHLIAYPVGWIFGRIKQ